jgi:hypothetical protein
MVIEQVNAAIAFPAVVGVIADACLAYFAIILVFSDVELYALTLALPVKYLDLIGGIDGGCSIPVPANPSKHNHHC